jgi:hypothetical protein
MVYGASTFLYCALVIGRKGFGTYEALLSSGLSLFCALFTVAYVYTPKLFGFFLATYIAEVAFLLYRSALIYVSTTDKNSKTFVGTQLFRLPFIACAS